jgi:hypothetical protein
MKTVSLAPVTCPGCRCELPPNRYCNLCQWQWGENSENPTVTKISIRFPAGIRYGHILHFFIAALCFVIIVILEVNRPRTFSAYQSEHVWWIPVLLLICVAGFIGDGLRRLEHYLALKKLLSEEPPRALMVKLKGAGSFYFFEIPTSANTYCLRRLRGPMFSPLRPVFSSSKEESFLADVYFDPKTNKPTVVVCREFAYCREYVPFVAGILGVPD